jgi:NAD(P)-dependent dehydrogenase (short-subunit alcohol dehydrogenase family)
MTMKRMPRYSLVDRSVIITGAAGGIGAATARELVARGAMVTLVDLSEDALAAVAEPMRHARAFVHVADVTNLGQMTQAVEAAKERFGKVDVVFANAGIASSPPTTLAAANLDAYERVIEVDLHGVIRTIKPALPEIIANQGHVLITASVYAFVNGVANSAYAASKAAVEMLGRSLRLELALHGASAGVLYPGWVATPIAAEAHGANATATALTQHAFRGPLGRFVEPEEIATAVADGIETRAARVIYPRVWRPVSALRGVVGALTDALASRDRTMLGYISQLEREAYSSVASGSAP